jgi:uncharacterized small protein (DUF1192 family)
MRFRKRHSFIGQDESSGWIAMTDLFTILTVVAISVGAANITTIKNLFKGVNDPWTTFVNRAAENKVELDSLNKRIKLLTEEITRLKTKLDTVLPGSSEFSDQIINLKQQISDLNQELTDLKNKCNVLELDLEKKKKELADLQILSDKSSKTKDDSNTKLDVALSEIKILLARIQEAQNEITALKSELDKLNASLNLELNKNKDLLARVEKLERINKELRDAQGSNTEGAVRAELLGLKPPLNRVVFVVDRSSSMNKTKEAATRWGDCIQTIKTWINSLPVKNAALVVFGDDIKVYPPDEKSMLKLPEGAIELTNALENLQPKGGTKTQDALWKAFSSYDEIDAIILFTDGAPDEGIDSVLTFVDEMARQKPNTRIYTVGIGDYLDGQMGRFLREVSKRTGGTFIGR